MDKPDYIFNTPEDFLENERFRGWVLGEYPEDRAFWEDFLTRNPDNRPLYEKAVATLLVIRGDSGTGVYTSADKVRGLQERLQQEADAPEPIPVWRWLRWAAAAMLVISLGFWWSKSEQHGSVPELAGAETRSGHPAEQWLTRKNDNQNIQLVNLPDGSSVLLSKGSSIRYAAQMEGNERNVYLDGEGFFEVVKNPAKPFFVHADKLVTRVLGTSFRVKSFADEAEAIVAVKTGKVSVITTNPQPLTLYPNQQVNLIRKKDKLLRTVTETIRPEQATPIEKEPFDFQFAPVSEAFKILETHYAVKIHYDQEKMSRCTLTASLKDEPFLEKIRLICLATESSYEVSGDQILISGLGCP